MTVGPEPGYDPRLVESEERYRAVIENASDMIQSVRADGTFEFVNRAWLNKLGYTEAEVAKLSIWDVVHPDSIEHCQPFLAMAMRGEVVERVDAVFRSKGGETIPVEGNVTPRFLGGAVVATHGFFRDITERLHAQELEHRNERLEREHLARYLEKMAALGKLSAGLAHELNNPAAAAQRASGRLAESLARRDELLRVLVGHGLGSAGWDAIANALADPGGDDSSRRDEVDPLETSDLENEMESWLEAHGIEKGWELAAALVQAGIDTHRLDRLADALPTDALGDALHWIGETLTLRETAQIIDRSSHRISDLVRAVKGYSHMDRATELVVDLHEGLESTLLILHHRMRNITVRRDYDRALPPVRVFGNTLNQVWTNILDNAIDATGGSGTIVISTSRDGESGVVEIVDDGSGIAPEHLTRIFEPFFTTKPQGEGTGLGLDTAWRIVTEEHNGKIDVDSKPGRTAFRVSIPLASDATAQQAG
jgi:PAS domain S-box-containing protein